jgi:hypothetical protein
MIVARSFARIHETNLKVSLRERHRSSVAEAIVFIETRRIAIVVC